MSKLGKKLKHAADYAKKTIKKIKDPYWKAKCNYIKYYENLPVNEDVILFESQSATKIDGNIFYLIEYVSSNAKYKNFKIYLSLWGRYVKKIRELLDTYGLENINITIYSSDEYVRLLASAKYLFNDATFPPYYIKKEGQVYLNTWHGTPLKTMGKSVHNDTLFGNVQKNMIVSDYLLYANEFSKEVFIRDYMLENISSSSYIMGGYPRNGVFFDDKARQRVRSEMGLEDKRVYAYMPTWRGTMSKVGVAKNDAYLLYYLCELDKVLNDSEIMFVNLHPIAMHAKNTVTIDELKHIRFFPSEYETYDFLNTADVLVTDYSSVFFDFACTRKKIVLFPYDKDEYLKDRGMYFPMDELPFPQVFDVPSLIDELRSAKDYDETEFAERFNAYDNINAAQQLCDFVILGEETGLKAEKIPDNGKENMLLYAGNLAQNGLTTSLRSLLNALDLSQRNYIVSFCQRKSAKNAAQLKTFPKDVNFLAIAEYADLTIRDRIIRKMFRMKLLKASGYMKKAGKRFEQEWLRAYGNARIDKAIQFGGYENDIILMYSKFAKSNAIFVHNDMVNEIKTRQTQRWDVLKYAYKNYDKVITVSEDIIPPTVSISGKKDNIATVHNIIDHKTIISRGKKPIAPDDTTECSVEREYFDRVMSSSIPKFINIGRYSPEKGHERLVDAFAKFLSSGKDAYLIIMGGNSLNNGYDRLNAKIREMGLQDKVILLLSVSNPYPILKACDYFIMSSFYEGLPMVIFEADIFKKPIASTDVCGPHGFLSGYGGTLVENSADGVYRGLNLLYDGKVPPLSIDYEQYNAQCVAEFESIFEDKK